MVIEKVHGLQATALSLNDRFTLLAKAGPAARLQQQRRRNSLGPPFARNFNYGNRQLVEQVARQLEIQAKRALKQRLGMPQLRRFGSESNLPRLQRSNSFGNLSQQSVKNRVSWRNNNGNLSRSASFSNLTSAAWRGFRRRAGGQRQLRGRFRGRGGRGGRGTRGMRGARGMRSMNGGVGRTNGVQQNRNRIQRPQVARRARRGARGRGGITRNQQPQKLKTKEELDLELDQYMAGTKAALDIELDNYMKNVMDLE